MSLIEIKNLTKQYSPEIKAVVDLSLDVAEGQIYGLLGPNGAGKTTLIRTLIGSLKPTSGTVKVAGLNPQEEKSKLRKKIGYMPQDSSLYEDLTAFENINFFANAHEIPNQTERINELLKFFGLTEFKSTVVSKFSGGMKRKLSLACALVHKPQILFLDEPTAAIDPILKESIWNLFQKLTTEEGTTIFVSTHAMEEAVKCNRLCILRNGELIFNSEPQEIFNNSNVKVTLKLEDGKSKEISTTMGSDLATEMKKHGLEKNISDVLVSTENLENIIIEYINEQ